MIIRIKIEILKVFNFEFDFSSKKKEEDNAQEASPADSNDQLASSRE